MTQTASTIRWCGGCSGNIPPNAWSTRKASSIWSRPPDVHAMAIADLVSTLAKHEFIIVG